jgi:hypothetical protein
VSDLRSLAAKVAAHSLHAQRDARVTTAPARAAFLASFEHQVDPDGLLSPTERARRAVQARKAHFARLALASAKARARKRKAAPDG